MKLARYNLTLNIHRALRREQFEGREHLVAPVVLMVEGVHAGSSGPVYYPVHELSKTPEVWNGEPLPVYHPQAGGEPVSANTPELIEELSIGRLFHCYFSPDGNQLRGEVYIDISKAESIAPGVLARVQRGDPVEVSTGLFHDLDGIAGTFHGEHYHSTVSNLRPDHLAILPDITGACSVADGCGIRTNQRSTDMKSLWSLLTANGYQYTAKPEFAGAKIAIFAETLVNELSHGDLHRKTQQAIDALDNGSWLHFVTDVFDTFVVFEARGQNPATPGGRQSRLFKQTFEVSASDDSVTLTGVPQEVRENRDFVPVTSSEPDANSGEEGTVNKDQLVAALVANAKSPFEEADKATLMTFTECKLKALNESLEEKDPEKKEEPATPATPATPAVEPAAVIPPAEPAAPVAPIAPVVPAAPAATPQPAQLSAQQQLDAYLAKCPPEYRAHVVASVNTSRAQKKSLIEAITANTANQFTAEELDAKDLVELQKMAAFAVPVNYAGTSPAILEIVPSPSVNAEHNQVPDMPSTSERIRANAKK